MVGSQFGTPLVLSVPRFDLLEDVFVGLIIESIDEAWVQAVGDAQRPEMMQQQGHSEAVKYDGEGRPM